MTLLNSILVYGLFSLMLTMGLCVDSTFYRNEIGSGNLLWLPVFIVVYGIPNWIGIAILSCMIGKMTHDTLTPIDQLWRSSIFTGLTIAASVIFGGSYLNVDQILQPTQADYFKIVSLIVLAGIGQRELKSFVKSKAD